VVGPATIHRSRATLRAAHNQAIRERRIDLNVAFLVELPSGRRPKALVWTPERVREWRYTRETLIQANCRTRPTGDGALDEEVRSPADAGKGANDRFVTNDIETLLTALYVKIDDELGGPRWTGRPPVLTDSELVCARSPRRCWSSPPRRTG
jgi:hypothetical protein